MSSVITRMSRCSGQFIAAVGAAALVMTVTVVGVLQLPSRDAHAQDATTAPTVPAALGVGQPLAGPSVTLDHYEVLTDSHVLLTVAGFRSNFVNASVCGNAARRGSGDCNVRGTKTIQLDQTGAPSTIDFIISVPPMPCPCLVRVAGDTNDEVAITEVRIFGHPSAPVVGSVAFQDSVEATIAAKADTGGFRGWLKSSLGGATEYEVTVSLHNRSTEAVQISGLDAWSGRSASDVTVSLQVDPPGRLEPGDTWRKVVNARLPAPVYGSATWQLEVTSEGQPTLVAKSTTSHLPGLLILLLVFLVVDLIALGVRVLARLKGRLEARPDRVDPANGPMATPVV